jgi:hypothetical protein
MIHSDVRTQVNSRLLLSKKFPLNEESKRRIQQNTNEERKKLNNCSHQQNLFVIRNECKIDELIVDLLLTLDQSGSGFANLLELTGIDFRSRPEAI